MKKENKTILKNWLDITAKDTLAFGSIVMFILAIARSAIGDYYTYMFNIILAGVILFILQLFIKPSENHLARGIIMFIFTILFYNQARFTSFIVVLLVLVYASAFYLKKPFKQIFIGTILGLISSGISYFVI